MSRGTCKGCGAPVQWMTTPNGEAMPLDNTYTKEPLEAKGTYVLLSNNRCLPYDREVHGDNAVRYMNHWATCPVAGSFKSKGKKQ